MLHGTLDRKLVLWQKDMYDGGKCEFKLRSEALHSILSPSPSIACSSTSRTVLFSLGVNPREVRGTTTWNVSAVDRFFHAANDFQVNCTWPPVTSGVNRLWDQFRLYVGHGLLVNPTIYRKPAEGDQDGPPDIDGDGDSPSVSGTQN
ncbi:hypothetical protein M405DRAFT_864273 [Rhizopogon salebrosus TDB-379]|nr:hypothetical protein M405DRAFT_864273 [Rhizopogon salebrosus TDB-379]